MPKAEEDEMAKKNRDCVQCGCSRALTIVAKVEDNRTGTEYGMRRLCLPCFLRMAHYDIDAPTPEMRTALYATVEAAL